MGEKVTGLFTTKDPSNAEIAAKKVDENFIAEIEAQEAGKGGQPRCGKAPDTGLKKAKVGSKIGDDVKDILEY